MFTVPHADRSTFRAIAWWEARRLGFNLWLAVVGAPSLALYAAAVRLESGVAPTPSDLLRKVGVAAIAANGLYTLGWIFETDPQLRQPKGRRDPVAIVASLEFGCWAVALACAVPALVAFVTAFGVWLRRT